MKRHVRIPHSKKIREFVRLDRKTTHTVQEGARHEHLYYWLVRRGARYLWNYSLVEGWYGTGQPRESEALKDALDFIVSSPYKKRR